MYFTKRLTYHNSRLSRLIKFLKSQEYRCCRCKVIFMSNDIIKLYHDLLKSETGSGKLEFVHGHCRDNIHN